MGESSLFILEPGSCCTEFSFLVVQAEVKRLTALVEEAAKKNRRLIALGSKYLFARALISAGVVSALALMIFCFL
jgi:hypothetical protein